MLKGLLLKDFLALKKTLIMMAVFAVFYFVLGMMSGNMSVMGGLLILLCIMLPINSLSYDDYYKWDRYALTMPLSRRDLVTSKYVLLLILCSVTFAVNVLSMALFGDVAWLEAVLSSCLLLSVGLLYAGICLPFIYKYGVEKGRWVLVLVAFAVFGLFALFSFNLRLGPVDLSQVDFSWFANHLELLSVLYFFVVVALFFGSYLLSVRIFMKKEL